MVIGEVRKRATQRLNSAGVTNTPGLDVLVLMKFVWDTDEIGLILMRDRQAETDRVNQLDALLARRMQGEPVAYLCGRKEFMSLQFDVCPGVLIPRGDTECIVEKAASFYKGKHPKILDIGTGSGCIAVSLAHILPEAMVSAVDISDKALSCARRNAEKNNVCISFSKLDILTEEPEGAFDLMISNPPYISTGRIADLGKDVKDYEPVTALDGGADGLRFYQRIIPIAARCLKKGGRLIFEIGWDQAQEVCSLFQAEQCFDQPKVIFDLAGHDRGIYTTKAK